MMKTYQLSIVGIALSFLSLCVSSCGENYPDANDQPYATDLLSIKIVNGGVTGTEVFEGTVDEVNKMVNFARMEPASDFSALKVEAKLSPGAVLENDVFDFSMDEADKSKTLLLRVKNHNRYKDYFIRVRKNVPVFGADFEKVTAYNFSGDNIYAEAKTELTRCVDFDGEHVLVVTRSSAKPHLLRVADLKAGNPTMIPLDLTGVAGGTYTYNMGALANGRVYMASLSGGLASPLKIYYWATPTSQPEVIANITPSSIPDVGVRHGDNISVNIDKNGNGFIFFGDNAGSKMLRLTVQNHKNISEPTVLTSHVNAKVITNVYRVGDTSEYIWTGLNQPVTLVDEGLSAKYTMKAGTIFKEGVAARVFNFNGSRYLMLTVTAYGSGSKSTPALHVYDISKGSTVAEALEIFENGENHEPVYSFLLGGSGNASAAAQSNYFIEKDASGKDAKLYLFAARTASGFVIVEANSAVAED